MKALRSLQRRGGGAAQASSNEIAIVTEEEMRRRDAANIAAALQQSAGRVYGAGGAAELLGMKPTTLNARIKKLGLKKDS
jgi:transcriptional regulator with GAF, ATPase, and Fis domain